MNQASKPPRINRQALLLLVLGVVNLIWGVAMFSTGAAMIVGGVLLLACAVGSLDEVRKQ